jgi:hypothetical protein
VSTLNAPDAAGGCPAHTDPKNGILVPNLPNSAAIGPDGNLYVGSQRDGAVIRILNPATFDPSIPSNCQNNIQIPLLSTDEAVGPGHTFGLGWIGHILFGHDNIGPWVLENADQCLTPFNANRICGSPALGGTAAMPTAILSANLGVMEPGSVASDAQYPSSPGSVVYFSSLANVIRVSSIVSAGNFTVQQNYGPVGGFVFITGLSGDPTDNQTVFVGTDPTQGTITGTAAIYLVTNPPPPPGPPSPPTIGTASTTGAFAPATTGTASLNWSPVPNGQPITSYVVSTFLTPAVPGGALTPAGLPDVTVTADPVTGFLATRATVTGLSLGTSYQFEVEACNLNG